MRRKHTWSRGGRVGFRFVRTRLDDILERLPFGRPVPFDGVDRDRLTGGRRRRAVTGSKPQRVPL